MEETLTGSEVTEFSSVTLDKSYRVCRLQPHVVHKNPWPGGSWQLSRDEERGVQGDKTERWIALSRWKCNLLPATQGRQNIPLLHFPRHLVSAGVRDGNMSERSIFRVFLKVWWALLCESIIKGSRWPPWELLKHLWMYASFGSFPLSGTFRYSMQLFPFPLSEIVNGTKIANCTVPLFWYPFIGVPSTAKGPKGWS